jgi:ribose transport system substrate-binding protein
MKFFTKTLLAATCAAFAVTGAQAAEKYVIGVSNGWVGSEWRTQMVEEAQAAAKAWGEKGVEVELLVQSKNVDVQTQIADVRNFINQGVDAILINPNSPTAFNPVFAQAKKADILVVATDGEVSSKDAYYVGIDQKEWAKKSAKWLADALGGKGEIVTINGVAGHPANQARIAGYQEVFAQYPDIKILNEASGEWDQAISQQTLKVLLATYPEIDGVWVQDGMADGARRAINDAGRTNVLATGEIRASYLKSWKEDGWTSGASVNPPGCMASALNFAVLTLEGGKLKDGALKGQYGNAIYLPIPLISNENLDDALKQVEGKPDYTSVTDVVSPETLKAEFFQ